MKSLILLFSTLLVFISGCTNKPAVPVEIEPHTKVCLAMGDKADGTADNVIEKCPACALSMNGSSKHKAVIEGYEIHSCTSDCNKALQEDPNKMFKDMKCDAESGVEEAEALPQK